LQLIAALDAHVCGAFLSGVPLSLKALRPKDYSETPQTLGEHLRKRRKELGLLQREAAERMGVSTETVLNWEKDKTRPVPSQFRPLVVFLGFDPTPPGTSLKDRLEAKRRALGITTDQVAAHLGWDPGSLNRYLRGVWSLSSERAGDLEAFLSADEAELTTLWTLARRRTP